MTTLPPEKPADFTASDILSADAWTGRAAKPIVGIDVVCTKIAVDFQNMRRESMEECIRCNLELLRGATGADCAFLAALSPEDGTVVDVSGAGHLIRWQAVEATVRLVLGFLEAL